MPTKKNTTEILASVLNEDTQTEPVQKGIMHPSEYLRRKLVSDKKIHLTELELIICQIENHSFKMNPEVQKSLAKLKKDLNKLSEEFDDVLRPEIAEA